MRHNAAGRRPRNRGHNGRRGGGQPNRMQVFDSNGPDVRIRGTSAQIYEKYMALAKDAAASGDDVLSESYLQHAEHYQRMLSGWIDLIEGRSDAYLYKPSMSDEPVFEEETGEIVAEEGELGLPASIIGTRTSQPIAQSQNQLEDA
ncbi:MAG: DUF4167 domain-containing protein [Micavibrio aeruginosavorus]|uniref:DUF4167 domain-containing protein n=1 Tax=Micavibrio aeruginosavorus TaxID=349221 RepID=A0A7T5UHH0_9BACT|nr:MAG: DUF4167 domain-containing protein [Micavibrio aeruginosavorus]